MVRNTQLEAWESIQVTLARRQKAVLNIVKGVGPRGITIAQIALCLNAKDNWVSGRVTELTDMGMITDSGRTTLNPLTRRPATLWTVPELSA